ncbi:hypothetical protein GGQ94_001813 [Petrimonas sulfuriphila]|jgi:hypothetical protein
MLFLTSDNKTQGNKKPSLSVEKIHKRLLLTIKKHRPKSGVSNVYNSEKLEFVTYGEVGVLIFYVSTT